MPGIHCPTNSVLFGGRVGENHILVNQVDLTTRPLYKGSSS